MNIKILICFIIILIPPVASASTTDKVWVAKSSEFIKNEETLSYNSYIIKAKVMDSSRSTVTVYRDRNLIETHILKIQGFIQYDDIRISLNGIKGEYSWISVSEPGDKPTLDLLDVKQLKWGEDYEIEGYSIEVDTFGTDSVNLRIYNESLSQTYNFLNNSFRDFGNLRLAIKNIDRTGFIELETLAKTAPGMIVEISTDKEKYYPDDAVNVILKTTGNTVMNVARIYLETDTETDIHPEMISATGMDHEKTFKFRITNLPVDASINITAIVETLDYYNNKKTDHVSKIIQITPEISVIKSIPAETEDENVTVELHIHNSGSKEEFISVYDTLIIKGNPEQLDWRIRLEPKRSKVIKYQVSPQKPGEYILPPAIIKWKKNSISSNQVKMIVHQPHIVITKTIASDDSITDVQLYIENTGDRAAKVSVSDDVPAGYQLINGQTTWSDFIEGGNSVTLVYTLQGNGGDLTLPQGTYRDIHGVVREAESRITESGTIITGEEPVIEKERSILNAGPYDMVLFMISSFISIAIIIGSVTAGAYLSIINRG